MKIEQKDEVIEPVGDEDILPPVEDIKPDPQAEIQERLRQSELNAARLEGELKARTVIASNVDQNTQLKNQVWTDVNTLSDEDFEKKWNQPKYKATTSILQVELDSTKTKNGQELASLRAENRLAIKYKDFYEVKDQIDEMVGMASQEVRQDPEKLSKYMEQAYHAATKNTPTTLSKEKTAMNRGSIKSGFEKPTSRTEIPLQHEDKDQLLPEYRELGRAFGITSEKERKKLLETPFVEMNLGNGKMMIGRELVDINAA